MTVPVAIIFIILSLIAIPSEERKIGLVGVLLLSLIALVTCEKSLSWGAWMNFQFNKSAYESVLAKVLTEPGKEELITLCKDRCEIAQIWDRAGAASVAFPYSISLYYSTKIIYDPIGVPGSYPNGFDYNDSDVIVKAAPLSKNWYVCYFESWSGW
jgi:hypothetical protein